jgi:long-subunit acyl-CoA synthetase (AMP-forming)
MRGTVIEVLERTARAHPEAPALARRGAQGWVARSWSDYRDDVLAAAAGFARLGVEPGDGVAILSANRPEWAIADLGAIAAGAIPTGLFVTSAPEQLAYVVGHAGARVAVVENAALLERLRASAGGLDGLAAVVLVEGAADEPGQLSWEKLLALGREAGEGEVRARLAAARPGDVATLIYTSGTTGAPKGVELTHGNLVFMAEFGARLAHRLGAGERQLSYLPLAHIAEQMLTLHIPLQSGACVHFVSELERLPEALREVRPTHFFGVPRVWEKLQAGIDGALAQAPPVKRALARWALGRGLAAGRARERGGRRPLGSALADRLVLAKIRARLGLDRAHFCGSAAAPIARATLERFVALGVPLVEVYGLSETTGVITASWPESFRIGRVGRPLDGVEMRVAADGEILARGPNIFRGYRSDPAATRAAIDDEGWFHTGDIGEVDAEGFLAITDRKKELLVTSGGKKVAPAPIESRLRAIPGIGQAVVVGEQRHFVAALLTLDPASLPALVARLGSRARTLAEGSGCPLVRAFVAREIERVNRALARFESVRAFHILPEELSIAGGELTPTLKLRRRTIDARYAELIDDLYAGSPGPRS